MAREGMGRGKKFEKIIHQTLVDSGFVVERLKDQIGSFRGVANGYDFIAYKYPIIYFVECKSVKGNRLPLTPQHIKNQIKALTDRSENVGVIAGIIVWFVDHDLTMFFDIRYINAIIAEGRKALRYDDNGQVFAGERLTQYFKYGEIYDLQQGGYYAKRN